MLQCFTHIILKRFNYMIPVKILNRNWQTVDDVGSSSLLELFVLKLSKPRSILECWLPLEVSSQIGFSAGCKSSNCFVLHCFQYGLNIWFQAVFRCLSPLGQFVEPIRWLLNVLWFGCTSCSIATFDGCLTRDKLPLVVLKRNREIGEMGQTNFK